MEKELATVEQAPKDVVIRGKDAATQLQSIVQSRKEKLVIGGKQYLFFEDWQTIGKFYGVTAKVQHTEEIREDGKLAGFLASAVAVVNGDEISGADAECTYDEQKWKSKPRFQLRSMAQTRACAKTLRNCLGWVAVLAGYETTPAEEMQDVSQPIQDEEEPKATPAQLKKIFATAKQMNYPSELATSIMIRKFNTGRSKELTKSQASEFIKLLESGYALGEEEVALEPEDIPY